MFSIIFFFYSFSKRFICIYIPTSIYTYYDFIFLGYVLFYNADVYLFIGAERLDEYIASESVVVVTVSCDTVLL